MKEKPIISKPFIIINYLDKNKDIFIDYDKKILSSEATNIQKEILKCYENDDYFMNLAEERQNEIIEELEK